MNSNKDLKESISLNVEKVSDISAKAGECDKAKDGVLSAMESLSALSEQNAASAEETSASMDLLNETVVSISDIACTMADIAKDLEEKVAFFEFDESTH